REGFALEINIGEFESFADYFFDGLIMDWIVQSRIEDSLNQAKHAKERIVQTVKNLERLRATAESRYAELKGARDQLIEGA
ncbi:MAG TPA: hypothetical protein VJQ25_10470, partial [Nitrospira sp.]|nr:hypothetical protein [Nitrospira sp.]